MTTPIDYVQQDYVFIDRPLWFHKAGLQQTRSGYGSKLTSSRVVKLADGRVRRVYIICWSNSGTAYVNLDGRRQYLDRTQLLPSDPAYRS